MAIKRLYTKILIAFLGVLIITEIMIIALFIMTAGRSFKETIEQQTIARIIIFKQLVQDKINNSNLPVSENKELQSLFDHFASLMKIDIWITDPHNLILLKTFNDNIPPDVDHLKKMKTIEQDIKIYFKTRRHFEFYAKIPLKSEQDFFQTLHIKFLETHHRKPEAAFFIGVLTIGIIIAFLIFPLSKVITIRIKRLNQSAILLANGDLSHRTDIKGKDEIAKLGRSFNFMANKLEQMIQKEKELTANISHELRSPLARIQISRELLQDKILNNDYKNLLGYLKHIEEDIESLDKLIEDILKISKMDIHDDDLLSEPLNISSILNSLINKFSPSLEKNKLTIKKQMDNLATIHADKDSITTAFSNLIDNAVKYTQENGTISVKVFKKENHEVEITIINTFKSLDADELKKICEPFFRISNNVYTGSGLGLFIAKKSIEKNGGSMSIQNSEQGLMFKITFPRTIHQSET